MSPVFSRLLLQSGGAARRSSGLLRRAYAAAATDVTDRQHSWHRPGAVAAALVTAGLGSLLLLQPQDSHCEEAKLASAGQTQALFLNFPSAPIQLAQEAHLCS